MTKMQGLFALLMILEIAILIMTSLKGAVYDLLKEDIDKNYSGNHSFSLKNCRFGFSIPRFINEKTDDKQLITASKIYNNYSILFWANMILLIVIYHFAY